MMWFGIAIVIIAAFLMWELRNTAPMLNLRYFLDPRFGVAAGVITLVFFAMFGFFFLMTQYFQLVLNYSPFAAGLRQLPFAAVMMVAAPNSPKFAARFGANVAVACGLIGISAAMFLFTIADVNTPYIQLVFVVMLMAGGMAMCIPTMTGSIMSAVPLGKAGVGSAMNDTTRELGGALGVAVLGSLVASRYRTRLAPAFDLLPASLRGEAGQSLAGALHASADPQVSNGVHIQVIAKQAFVSGMHLAAIIAGCVALLAAGIVYRKLPGGNPHAKGAASLTRESPELVPEH
jgi:predicted MFS family arabinose efflux permease